MNTFALDKMKFLSWGADVLRIEARELNAAAERLGSEFYDAAEIILNTPGKVIVSGLGKSGHIASKIAATFASTGTPAFFLHPSEALHGDLGMISATDTLFAIAYGGETHETIEVAKYARRLGLKIICLTGKVDSNLARLSNVVLNGSIKEEACPLNLAPTSSSALALALGDALAVVAMRARGFNEHSFANIHPGGSLGKRLMLVTDLMRKVSEIGLVQPSDSFYVVMEKLTKPNFGIVGVTSKDTNVVGAVTDGDVRRALSKHGADALAMTAQQFMSVKPKTIPQSLLAVDAFREMERFKITSLFVTETPESSKIVGLLRMHDLLEHKIV